SACGALARAEQHVERRLALAVRDVPLPGNLRERLLTRLQRERQAWFWRLPHRHPRVTASVAAVFLLAVGLILYAAFRPPRPLDLVAIADKWNGEVSLSPEEVQKAFAEKGFTIPVPSGFNYQYLLSYDLQEFNGTMVPHLLFVHGPQCASVYILSGSHFD